MLCEHRNSKVASNRTPHWGRLYLLKSVKISPEIFTSKLAAETVPTRRAQISSLASILKDHAGKGIMGSAQIQVTG